MHKFFIPVMGTGFTIDSAVRVAPMGVDSVVSLVDDDLIEQMRKYHSERTHRPYTEIRENDEDSRARRITAYLDLLQDLVEEEVSEIRKEDLTSGSRLEKYFLLQPEGPLRQEMLAVQQLPSGEEKTQRLNTLKEHVVPGRIDVNIMTKLNRPRFKGGEALPVEYADALAALRGLAKARGKFSVIFSAGMNAPLYSYLTQFNSFCEWTDGFNKEIILKVSDYRSALIQGKFLAKKGIWVSEYRIESGLNCGGHAFATQGYLLGPLLEEFREKRQDLLELLRPIFAKSAQKANRSLPDLQQLRFQVTVQGGLGQHSEAQFLHDRYGIDRTGWGTPFLLVPEVTRVDEEHIEKLKNATKSAVQLSKSSPLGIGFWNLMTSSAETLHSERLEAGQPGSPCPKGFIRLNTDFTKKPICRASKGYQKLKIQSIEGSEDYSQEQKDFLLKLAMSPSCICHDLAGGATKLLGIDPEARPAICCGPNIVNFSKVVSFKEMVDHIYGRQSQVEVNPQRPHQFVAEAQLYLENLVSEWKEFKMGVSTRDSDYFVGYLENFTAGLSYYINLFSKEDRLGEVKQESLAFLEAIGQQLRVFEKELQPNFAPEATI